MNTHTNNRIPQALSKTLAEEYILLLKTHDLKTPGSLREFQKVALLDEAPNEILTAHQMIEMLNKDHTSMSARLKEHMEEAEEHGDTAAVTLYEDLITFHDKAAWMIRSHRA